jgi:hypothetical protein
MSQSNSRSENEVTERGNFAVFGGVARWGAVIFAILAFLATFIYPEWQIILVWFVVVLMILSILLDRSSIKVTGASLVAIALALIYIFTR